MSPYFMKYGYSERFHSEFVAAEKEAKAALIGIWDPKKQHYPDYAERAVWWNARAEFVHAFKEEAKGKPHYIELTHWDAIRRLQQHEGKEIVILGTVGSIKLGDKGPTRVMLSRRLGSDIPLIFFDKDVFGTSRIAKWKGEYVKVTGRVSKWYNKYRKRHELQIVISLPGQIVGSDKVPDYSRWNPDPSGDEHSY
jgi:hypothetical protein